MSISVIIPAFNSENHIHSALESVVNQTYQPKEVIVIDDASTDNTANLVLEQYPSVNLIQLRENGGAARARNKGLSVASGELIAFLDSDDQWLPNYLETQINALAGAPDAVLVVCDYLAVKRNGSEITISTKPLSIYPDLTHHLLVYNFIPTMSLVVLRKKMLPETSPLREDLKIAHDFDLYLRLSTAGNILHVPHTLMRKVDHSDNLTANYRRCLYETYEALDSFFNSEAGQAYSHLQPEVKAKWSFNFSKWVWDSHGDYVFSTLTLLNALRHAPKLALQKAISQSISRLSAFGSQFKA
ncbi:MAG: glycosyltransferase [Cyanobacteria bacterium P01_C01_bin.73]